MAKKKKTKKKASSSSQIKSLQKQINSLKSSNEQYKSKVSDLNNQLASATDYDRLQSDINQANQESAAQQMAFQDYMSSTAHQREVTDLVAAGLNPILSANQGAAAGMGAYASVDSSLTAAKMAEKQLRLQLQNQKEINEANIVSQQYMNKYNTDMGYKLGIAQAGIGAAATRAAAAMSAGATMYAANQAAAASRYGADNALKASKYQSDNTLKGKRLDVMGNVLTTGMNNAGQAYRQRQQLSYDSTHASNPWQIITNASNSLMGNNW